MKHRYTIKELKEMSDLQLLRAIVSDRQSSLTNVYSPLYERLNSIYRKIDILINEDSGVRMMDIGELKPVK